MVQLVDLRKCYAQTVFTLWTTHYKKAKWRLHAFTEWDLCVSFPVIEPIRQTSEPL
jgi:hypothetical protein